MNYLATFERALNSPSAQPECLALLLGSLVSPHLDVDAYLDQLDALAEEVDARLSVAQGYAHASALLHVLYDQLGFVGNHEDYYAAENSFLHRVLEQRTGLPISLSLLYMAIGRRLGLVLQGMGFPGHFMLRYVGDDGVLLLDPFHGRSVPPHEIDAYFTQISNRPTSLELPLDNYQVNTRALILRMLNNLRVVYLGQDNVQQAQKVLDFLVLIAPEETAFWRERALLRFQTGHYLDAESDLRRVFYQRQQIQNFIEARPAGEAQPFMPIFDPASAMQPSRDTLDLMSLLERIRETISRLN